jgi:hypothetical protein
MEEDVSFGDIPKDLKEYDTANNKNLLLFKHTCRAKWMTITEVFKGIR